MPLAIRTELSDEDVEAIRSGGAAKKLTVPVVLALGLYLGLQLVFGDELPDLVLYALLGATFLVNALLSFRRGTRHYAAPGPISVTFSADGMEVSAETWAGHVPWVLVDRFDRSDELLVVHTAGDPSFHAVPIDHLDPEALAHLDEWHAYWRSRRSRRRPIRWLAILAALAFVVLAALWLWDRAGRPL